MLSFYNTKAFINDTAYGLSHTNTKLCVDDEKKYYAIDGVFRIVAYNVHNWHKICNIE